MGGKNRLKAELRSAGSKTRSFCPSEAKAARFQASLSSPSRRGTMPALPSNGFFYLLAFAKFKYLNSWDKSCVFFESIGLSLYILAARLCRVPSKRDSGRLNLQRSLRPSPNTFC
ncbi:MAG: hypothetical protein WBC20_07760 [Candidatus Aminicenantaceae bacterium]